MIRALRANPTRAVVAAAAALTAAGLALLARLAGSGPPAGVSFPSVHWLALAALFAAADTWGIHLPTRRGAHTLTLSEVPLVLGLASASPAALAVGATAGLGLALVLRRRPPLKIAFNLAHTLAGAAVAATIVHASGAAVDTPFGWLTLVAAAAAAGLLGASSVAGAVLVSEPDRRLAEAGREVLAACATSMAAAVVGLLVVVLLSVHMWALVLVTALIGGAFFAVNVYGRLYRRHEELGAVYGFTRAIEGPLAVDEIVERVLAESAHDLRADHVGLILERSDGSWHLATLRRGARSTSAIDRRRAMSLVAALGRSGRLITDGDGPLSEWAFQQGPRGVLAAPLLSSEGSTGLLLLADRPGPEPDFTDDDRRLVEALGRHAGATLERAAMEERLRAEIGAKQAIIRSKDQLIAAVSHELRTPLTGILGFAELLRDGVADERARRDMVEAIAAESLDLSNIVEDLLTAARVELGSLAVRRAPVDLAELVGRVVSAVDSGDRSLRCELEPAPALVDGPRVRQIVRNLVANSLRYGGTDIRVVTRLSPHPVIEVSDDGDGIGDTDPEVIFRPYTSAHQPGTQPGSVGLGLTISRELARLMGGDLSYQRRGDRSVFTLRLEAAVPSDGSGVLEPPAA